MEWRFHVWLNPSSEPLPCSWPLCPWWCSCTMPVSGRRQLKLVEQFASPQELQFLSQFQGLCRCGSPPTHDTGSPSVSLTEWGMCCFYLW